MTVIADATPKQMAFISRLAAERGVEAPEYVTKREASALIDRLMAMPKIGKAARTEVEAGFYRVGDDIYRVRPARAGTHNYAMILDGTEADGKPVWVYSPAMRMVAAEGTRLSVDEAAAYGVTHGYCLICSRLLTTSDSIARGIGPVCAGKL